jgi:hypothetical protein
MNEKESPRTHASACLSACPRGTEVIPFFAARWLRHRLNAACFTPRFLRFWAA